MKLSTPTRPAALQVVIFGQGYRCFDYKAPPDSKIVAGCRVKVPLRRKLYTGIVIGSDVTAVDADKLLSIDSVLDDDPIICDSMLRLFWWVADYYHCLIGSIIRVALPKNIKQGKSLEENHIIVWQCANDKEVTFSLQAYRQKDIYEKLRSVGRLDEPALKSFFPNWRPAMQALQKKGLVKKHKILCSKKQLPENAKYALTKEQKQAIKSISDTFDSFACHLLQGVTSSGKTEVYLQLATSTVARRRQVLILVPEISLIMQTVERFNTRFGTGVTSYHSRLSDKERHRCWSAVARGNINIVVGTRSAIFLPFRDLGIIIIDEEHDASYKQETRVRYHARDVAIKRAKLTNIPIVLGSATPSLETLYNSKQNKDYQCIHLPYRVGQSKMISNRIIDMRTQSHKSGLSDPLLQAIAQRLENDEQVLLFLNRRGYAPAMVCQQCRHPLECSICDAYQVYHLYNNKMSCHHCGKSSPIPKVCPLCGGNEFKTLGIGTEQVEKTLNEIFPSAGILRFDRDVIRKKGQLEQALESAHQARRKEAQILLGTQMLVKGHHFTKVTLVGILNVDDSLFSADFRAVERLAQTIIQVSGRAGRGGINGDVMIQTHYPEDINLKLLLEQNYNMFADYLLGQRCKARLPPNERLAIMYAESKKSGEAIKFLNTVFKYAGAIKQRYKTVELSQPIPALMEKRENFHRACILITANNSNPMHYFLNDLISVIRTKTDSPKVLWNLDVDPINMS